MPLPPTALTTPPVATFAGPNGSLITVPLLASQTDWNAVLLAMQRQQHPTGGVVETQQATADQKDVKPDVHSKPTGKVRSRKVRNAQYL